MFGVQVVLAIDAYVVSGWDIPGKTTIILPFWSKIPCI